MNWKQMVVSISVVLIIFCFFALWVWQWHLTERLYIKSGYTRQTLPGFMGQAWVKQENGVNTQFVNAFNALNNRVKNIEDRWQERKMKEPWGSPSSSWP